MLNTCNECYKLKWCMLTEQMKKSCGGPFSSHEQLMELISIELMKKTEKRMKPDKEATALSIPTTILKAVVYVSEDACEIKNPMKCEISLFTVNKGQNYIACGKNERERRYCPFKCAEW